MSTSGLSAHQVFNSNLFAGDVIIVTGGGSGIGRDVALEAAKLGAKVAICGRRLEPLRSTISEIEKIGSEGFYADCDVRDGEKVEEYVKKVLAKFGKIDILINNAGGQFPVNAELLSSKGFDAVIKNNLSSVWNMTRAVATIAFIPQKKGHIVNVIAQIKNGFPGMVHTGAARAGVANMTKTLAVEWAKFGIRINSVAPGVIKSTGTNRYHPSMLDRAIEVTPQGRVGTTEEVATIILFLASEKTSSFVTGQIYYLDGGQSLGAPLFAESWTNGRSSSSTSSSTSASTSSTTKAKL